MPNPSFGDRKLHQRLIGKDLDALAEAYDSYASVVFGVALKVTGRVDSAEEVTRDVFLDLWREPDGFHPDQGALRPWLAAVAHQRAVAIIRDQHDDATIDIDQVIDIDETVQSVLRTEEVLAALGALPEDERTPIRLAYFSGKTYRQVATDLGIAEDIVKARMYSGLVRMTDSLHAEGVGQDS